MCPGPPCASSASTSPHTLLEQDPAIWRGEGGRKEREREGGREGEREREGGREEGGMGGRREGGEKREKREGGRKEEGREGEGETPVVHVS